MKVNVQVAADAKRVWHNRHHVPPGTHNEQVNFRLRQYFDKTPRLQRGEELSDKELLYYGLKKRSKQQTRLKKTEDEPTNEAPSSGAAGGADVEPDDGAAASAAGGTDAEPGDRAASKGSNLSNQDGEESKGDNAEGSSVANNPVQKEQKRNSTSKRKSTLKRSETHHLVEASGSKDLSLFYEWMVAKFGNLTRGWRMLDETLNMSLSSMEFLKGCAQYKFSGNARSVFKELDRDDTGCIQYYHFDPSGALELAQLTSWCESMGGVEKTFHLLDVDRNGKLTPEEFIKGARKNGLPSDEPVSYLFHMLDFDKSKTLSKEELRFLEKWPCPPFLKVQPDFDGRSEFKQALLAAFNANGIIAWRKGIDTDGSMRVNWHEFHTCIQKVHKLKDWKDRYAAVFRAFDHNISGWLSLREFDPESYRLLFMFKGYCNEKFGGVIKAFAALDVDQNCAMNRNEFTAVVHELELTVHEKNLLFDGLDLDGFGTIRPSEIRYLDHWDIKKDTAEEDKWRTFQDMSKRFAEVDSFRNHHHNPGVNSNVPHTVLKQFKSDLKAKTNIEVKMDPQPWLQDNATFHAKTTSAKKKKTSNAPDLQGIPNDDDPVQIPSETSN